MPQCSKCHGGVEVYDRNCRTCGASVRRSMKEVISSSPTDDQHFQARSCHLLAIPGMIFMGPLSIYVTNFHWPLALLPMNLFIPLIYWLLHRQSPFVRMHGAEALNFQLLWTVVMYMLLLVPLLFTSELPFNIWLLSLIVWLAGSILVWVASNDMANMGKGEYPVRISLFK